MMMVVLVGLSGLVPVAHAGGTYEVDFEIVGSAPVGLGPNQVTGGLMVFDDVATGHPDQQVTASWPYITCAIDDGDVHVRFAATPSTWPTSWPSTVTCGAQGHTLVMHLVDAKVPYVYEGRSLVPSVGIALHVPPIDGAPTGVYRVFDLPTGPAYQEGTWMARLSPSVEWAGVQCGMAFAPNGNPTLQLFVHPDAAANEGYCVLESTSGVPHAIALEVTR